MVKDKIFISIIVPIYNIESYLEKCINSIINQTYSAIEIVLVDDGSTDGSGEICDEYAKNDSRIVVIHKDNEGLVSARKAGAEMSTGEYVLNVDGDDWIEIDRIEKLVNTINKYYPSMVYLDGTYREYEDRSSFSKMHEDIYGCYDANVIWEDIGRFLLRGQAFIERITELSQWSWCIKRDLYCEKEKYIDNRIKWLEDVILVISCMVDSENIAYSYNPSYHYLQKRPGSINAGSKEQKKDGEAGRLLYREMNRIIDTCKQNIKASCEYVLTHLVYNGIILSDYDSIYNYYNKKLFPFVDVFNGSKIVIYGAGNVGMNIYDAINRDKRFEIIAVVDEKPRFDVKRNIEVESLDSLIDKEFDFIIVAIMNSRIAKKVREKLEKITNYSKIKTMSDSDMSTEELMKIFG